MTGFEKYQHVERWNTEACEGLLDGVCYIFYKLDGTNASAWMHDQKICGGSRNRTLTLDNDNAGFYRWLLDQSWTFAFFHNYPYLRLYGEWLVPHSLKSYTDDAWRRFYVFDVQDTRDGKLLSYEAYRPLLVEVGIDYIPPLAIVKNPSEEHILKCIDQSGQFLVKDGLGKGEGIVIKNYDYVNKFGNQIWGKVVTNEFKILNHAAMGVPFIGSDIIEEQIVQNFLTDEFIKKEQAKIIWNNREILVEGEISDVMSEPKWENKYIPELLGRVWYEFIREETYEWTKKYKNPKVNFRVLQQFVTAKTKEVIGI